MVEEVRIPTDKLGPSELTSNAKVDIYGATEASPDHENQDNFFAYAENIGPKVTARDGLIVVASFGVFDGVSASREAGAAAFNAKTASIQTFKRSVDQDVRTPLALVEKAMDSAHTSVKALRGPLTTADIVRVLMGESGEKSLVIGHVGDGRVYKLTHDGKLVQLTRDDSVLWEEADRGIIDFGEARDIQSVLDSWGNYAGVERSISKASLQDRERGNRLQSYFDRRHQIVSTVGSDSYKSNVVEIDVSDAILIFACSDGIYESFPHPELELLVSKYADHPAFLPQAIIGEAEKRSSIARLAREKLGVENDVVRNSTDDKTVVCVSFRPVQNAKDDTDVTAG